VQSSHDPGADEHWDIETDVIDLSAFSLSDLEQIGPSSFGHALRRVLRREDATDDDPVVGFTASI
jgi:FXSXX-COOH protein